MGRLTENPFAESCCDGGTSCEPLSAQPCGCDPKAGWTCEAHRALQRMAQTPKQEISRPVQPCVVRLPEEVRVTDPLTGGQKGAKLARFSLIPAEFLWALAEHYGKGAFKYADRNWERGYAWSLTVDAMERHWTQFKLGERIDPETGSHHLISAAWHCVALFIFDLRGLGTDDVTPKEKAPRS